MSDTGDDFRFLRKRSQEKRAKNRSDSRNILMHAGVVFQDRNNGEHLIVEAGKDASKPVLIDFWPGTGKWIQRNTQSHQRGVDNLIRFVRAIS